MIEGIENLHREGARVEGDVLMTRNNQARLAAIVELYAGLGISRFNFWLVSGHGLPVRVRSAWIPRMRDLAGHLEAAFRTAKRLEVEAVTLHTPPCVLPAPWRSRYVHSGAWDLVVIPPGGDPFRAEASPMEGGVFLPGCRQCTSRTDCLGLRADYLDLFGGDEFTPIRSSARRAKS
jgi:hypothetical protein